MQLVEVISELSIFLLNQAELVETSELRPESGLVKVTMVLFEVDLRIQGDFRIGYNILMAAHIFLNAFCDHLFGVIFIFQIVEGSVAADEV